MVHLREVKAGRTVNLDAGPGLNTIQFVGKGGTDTSWLASG